MLDLTPRLLLYLSIIFLITFYANYPIFMVGSFFYYLLIAPNSTNVLLILGAATFIAVLVNYISGERWFDLPCGMMWVLYLGVVSARYFFNIDIAIMFGPPLLQATNAIRYMLTLFLSFYMSIMTAFFKVAFTPDFIVKVLFPFYILFHVCYTLLFYTDIFTTRTCTFMAMTMALIGAKGGVLNTFIGNIFGVIFKGVSDPFAFTISVFSLAMYVITLDALISVLWWVMGLTPEERVAFWSQVGEKGAGGAFRTIAAKFRQNPARVKIAKMRTLDPARISNIQTQALTHQNVHSFAISDLDKLSGTMRRGAFSNNPVYSTGALNSFRWLNGRV